MTAADAPGRAHARHVIRESLADAPELLAWFDAEAPDPSPARPFRFRTVSMGVHEQMLYVDTGELGVHDITAAVALAVSLRRPPARLMRWLRQRVTPAQPVP